MNKNQEETMMKKNLEVLKKALNNAGEIQNAMTDEELHKMIDSLSSYEQDRIYRYLWSQRVREDVISHAENVGIRLDDGIIDTIVDRYVERGDYDCNLDYWTNIENLIEEEGGNNNEN